MKILGFIVAAAVAIVAAAPAWAQDATLCALLRQDEARLTQTEANYSAASRTLTEMMNGATSVAPNIQTASQADLNGLLAGLRQKSAEARAARSAATDAVDIATLDMTLGASQAMESYVADVLVLRMAGADTAARRRAYEAKLAEVSNGFVALDRESDYVTRNLRDVQRRIEEAGCPALTTASAPPAPLLPPMPAQMAGRWSTSLGEMTILVNGTGFSAVTLDGYVAIEGQINGAQIAGVYRISEAARLPGKPYAEMQSCPQPSGLNPVWGTVTAGLVRDTQGEITAFEGEFDYCQVRGPDVTLQRFRGEKQPR